jgi:hypothetical protein
MPQKVHLSVSAFDKALRKEASEKYKLSIQLSLDGFFFSIFDIERNKFAAIEAYSFQHITTPYLLNNTINDLISKSEWLNLSFNQIRIMVESSKSTLVPAPLFDINHAHDYLKFNHHPDFGDQIQFDRLQYLDAFNIFSAPEIILNTFHDRFPGARIHHFASSLIESLLITNKNRDQGMVIFADVRKSWFDVLVFSGKNLIFHNSFRYRAREDFVYFLLYIMEHLNLNPETTELILLGEISKTTSLFELIYKYVRNISFGSRLRDYEYSYALDEIPGHYYYNLLSLLHCEL